MEVFLLSSKIFGQIWLKKDNNEWSWASSTIKIMPVTSAYTFNSDHIYKSEISGEVSGTTNYVAGGATLGSKFITYHGANSSSAWVSATPVTLGQICRPVISNNHIYVCTTSGTTGGTEPIWGTVSGGNTTDGSTVVWRELGNNVTLYGGATSVAWPNSTIPNAVAVIIYASTGVDSTSVVLAYQDLGGTKSSSDGNFEVDFDVAGILKNNIS